MKTLILFRHGKSRWDENVSDQFRTLSDVGLLRTPKSAIKLKKLVNPSELNFFSSIANRAKQTAEIAKHIISPNSTITYDKELYTFSHIALKNWIKTLDNSLDYVIVFGHNPAFTDIAYDLGTEFILNVPTSGVVWIEFEVDDWQSISKGFTKHVIIPKDLE